MVESVVEKPTFPRIPVEIVLVHPLAEVPTYATEGASGFDLKACIDAPITLKKRTWQLIPSGYRVSVPYGFEIQVRPRSGLALKKGITVKNTPGTVDADYRGVLGVILYNESDEDYVIEPGDRIAQAVICPVYHAEFKVVKELSETSRGEGGFGSTGTK